MSALNISNLTVNYGPLTALRDVSLSVLLQETMFIVGPNGAGKSTLLRAVARAIPIAEGEITLFDVGVNDLNSESMVALGFTMVPEGREIFGSLTVEENLRIGAYRRNDEREIRNDFEFVLERLPALTERLSSKAQALSGGQQQMLAIGRALMANPKLIALDEPSLGLAPKIVDEVYSILMEFQKERSLTLVISEQSFARAVTFESNVIVLRNGYCVGSGNACEMKDDGSLEKAYFGF